MATTTEPERIQSAKKKHLCSWCGQAIESGSEYVKYRFFDGGDCGTVKEHPECYQAMHEMPAHYMPDDGFTPGDHPRGCWCDFEEDCPKCNRQPRQI